MQLCHGRSKRGSEKAIAEHREPHMKPVILHQTPKQPPGCKKASLEMYSVFFHGSFCRVFLSAQHSSVFVLAKPTLLFPPHLQPIQAQEIQHYLKYLTKGLNYSVGRRRELPHGYSSRAGWQALRDSLLAASNLPQAAESSPRSSPRLGFSWC